MWSKWNALFLNEKKTNKLFLDFDQDAMCSFRIVIKTECAPLLNVLFWNALQQKFGPAQNILEPVEGTYILITFQRTRPK